VLLVTGEPSSVWVLVEVVTFIVVVSRGVVHGYLVNDRSSNCHNQCRLSTYRLRPLLRKIQSVQGHCSNLNVRTYI
jgi:hypothetical protein